MKITKFLLAIGILATVSFTSCKPKDADVQANVETALKAMPDMGTGMAVDVKDGVATLTGVCKDDACKAACEKAAAAIKGVKSVVNSCTIAPPPVAPASVTTVLDAATQQKVKDGLKDIHSVTLTGFSEKGAILTGTVTAAENTKIHQILASAKVLLDADSKLTVK